MLDLVTRADLQRLVDEKLGESLTLDYKAGEALKNTDKHKSELAKDVSAFANSAGGQIIYGVIEADQVPIRIDDSIDRTVVTAEWIDEVLRTNISPIVEGLRIQQIDLGANAVAYVLTIPQAVTRAPHQALREKRYYRRFEFTSVPMVDYEIRDMFRRASAPEPYIRFRALNEQEHVEFADYDPVIGADPTRFSEPQRFRAHIGNRSSAPAEWLVCNIIVSADFQVSMATADGVTSANIAGEAVRLHRIKLGQPASFPIFRETVFDLVDFSLRLTANLMPGPRVFRLGYTISTPGFSGGELSYLRLENSRLTLDQEDPTPVRLDLEGLFK